MGKGQILEFIEYDPFRNPNTCTNQHNSQNHIFIDDESSSNMYRQYERVKFDRRTDRRKRIKKIYPIPYIPCGYKNRTYPVHMRFSIIPNKENK